MGIPPGFYGDSGSRDLSKLTWASFVGRGSEFTLSAPKITPERLAVQNISEAAL